MTRPPMLMHIKVQNQDKKFGLWLPLFLLMPLALVILIILSSLILIAILVLWPSGWGRYALLALKAAFVTFWSTRGLEVDVQNGSQCVYVSIV